MAETRHISPYNSGAITRGETDPCPITVRDCTLREGEQAAEISLGLKDKVILAHKLDDAGIHQIQGGYPGRSKIDKETIQTMKREGIKAKTEALVQVFQKDWKEQIDAAVESGADVITLMYPGSDIRLLYVQKKSRSEMVKSSVAAVTYATQSGRFIVFSPVDTTRTELPFLKEIYSSVIAAGAQAVSIADTAGAITPFGMRTLVRELLPVVKVPISVHCHNDFGLALANAISAVEAGARVVDATIGGLGERAGNVCLDELIVTLQVLYGLDLGIKMDQLGDLTKCAFQLMGIPLPPTKPLVGENAFAHKLDAHVEGVVRYPFCYETISPELIGSKRRLVIGKYSGPFIIKTKLSEFGFTADEDQVRAMVGLVEQKAIEKKSSLSDDEFKDIVERVKSGK
jgi:isopropylmalate/homocitrate/citramalate synthase